MRKKILSVVLSFSMIFSMTGFAFADTDLNNPPAEPTKPKVENYQDNDKIEEYNKEAKEYNSKVDEYNTAVDKEYEQAVKDIDEANAKEKERVDQVNAEKQEAYEKEMAQYEKDKEQYEKDKEYEARILADPRYDSIEQYNQVVTDYNTKVDTYNGQVSNFNKAYGITDETANKSPQRNANAPKVKIEDTYTVIEAENKSGREIPVHIEHIFPGTDIKYVADFKIDANDTIILRGIAPNTDFPLKGSCYFFYNTDANHSVGMWANANSKLLTNKAPLVEWGWENGDTHTVSYANSPEGSIRKFDDITITYEYQWIKLYQQRDHVALANTPIEPILPSLDLETFTSLTYPEKRAYLTSLSMLSLFPVPRLIETAKSKGYTPVIVADAVEKPSKKTIAKEAPKEETSIEKIKGANLPKTIQDVNSWALINLIATILTIILALILLIMYFINKRKEDDETQIKNKPIKRMISVIVGIITAIIFIITEDMSLPMVLIDQWTLLMIILLIIQIIVTILCKHKKIEKTPN